MHWKLEVVPIPVSDVDRAKHFYSEQLGFVVDLVHHQGRYWVINCSAAYELAERSREVFRQYS